MTATEDVSPPLVSVSATGGAGVPYGFARATVIPVLAYPDVNQAAARLYDAFGFTVRLRIGNHRVELNVGEGAVTVREMRQGEFNAALGVGNSITFASRASMRTATGPIETGFRHVSYISSIRLRRNSLR